MSAGAGRRLEPADSDAMQALGARLARRLPGGAGPLVLHLQGELGSGKTTFARGFLHGLGVTAAVRSPTYTLIETYPLSTGFALHMDLFRLAGEDEFEQLGSRDYFVPGAIWLVEWPERAPRVLPVPDLKLKFAILGAVHALSVESMSATGAAWLAAALPEAL